jgi:hypothetical protein
LWVLRELKSAVAAGGPLLSTQQLHQQMAESLLLRGLQICREALGVLCFLELAAAGGQEVRGIQCPQATPVVVARVVMRGQVVGRKVLQGQQPVPMALEEAEEEAVGKQVLLLLVVVV